MNATQHVFDRRAETTVLDIQNNTSNAYLTCINCHQYISPEKIRNKELCKGERK